MSAPVKAPRVTQINVVRFLAMLGVFFHHLWKGIPGLSESSALARIVDPLFQVGDQGVGLFNIMTGFVLAWPHLGPDAKPPLGWIEFQKKRFLRIIPAYYLAMAAALALTPFFYGGWGNGRDLGWYAVNVLERVSFLHSWNAQALMTNVAAYWWLGLLAQVYLTFPFILRWVQTVGPARAALTSMAVCWTGLLALKAASLAFPALGGLDWIIYFNLPARLPEFMLGVWLAAAAPETGGWQGWRSGVRADWLPFAPALRLLVWAALAVTVIGLFLPKLPMPFGLVYNTARAFSVFALILCLPGMDRLGGWKPVATLAAASYSIYLTHQPIQGFAHELLKSLPPATEFLIQSLLVGGFIFLVSIGLDRVTSPSPAKKPVRS